jgi:hypothetical protein
LAIIATNIKFILQRMKFDALIDSTYRSLQSCPTHWHNSTVRLLDFDDKFGGNIFRIGIGPQLVSTTFVEGASPYLNTEEKHPRITLFPICCPANILGSMTVTHIE